MDSAATTPPREVLRLTWAALQKLPEYSGTLPTGTEEGKRWRRNLDAPYGCAGYGTPTSRWVVGEYGPVETDGPAVGQVRITWYDVEVVDG